MNDLISNKLKETKQTQNHTNLKNPQHTTKKKTL